MPYSMAYPQPKEFEPIYSHPLARTTSFFEEVWFVLSHLGMPYEKWLAETSPYEKMLERKVLSLRRMKDGYANSSKADRDNFPI